MRELIIENDPGSDFWNSYSELWYNSTERSPFQSPLLLRYFASVTDSIITVQLLVDKKLKGAAVLKVGRNYYSFLSDLKTDANFFVMHPGCTFEEKEFFFSGFLREIRNRKWRLILNNVPNWADYMEIFESCGVKSKLYFKKIDYSVCPAIEGNLNETVFDIVKHSRQVRYPVNRLKSQLNATFEVMTGGEDLEKWTDEFCRSHVLRWENTPTPSGYKDPEKQAFLAKCLEAWAAQKILVRFSVIVNQRRIGFVIGLLNGRQALIHHSTTFHPEFRKYGAGKAVVFTMAEWMLNNNLTLLDFGDGDEDYKFILANKRQLTSRIFISAKSDLGFILKSEAIGAVRNNPVIYRIYRNKLRRHIKPKLNRSLNK